MGSPEHFEAVYQTHLSFVWRSLQRLGVRDADLSDVSQEVFLVVHRRLDTFEGRSSMATWLFRICFNTVRNYHRSARARQEVIDQDHIATVVDASADTASGVTLQQQRMLLQALLDAMQIDQRAVFVLYELEETPAEAIAEALEIPLATVYSRLRLAREAFRHALTRYEARQRFSQAEASGQR